MTISEETRQKVAEAIAKKRLHREYYPRFMDYDAVAAPEDIEDADAAITALLESGEVVVRKENEQLVKNLQSELANGWAMKGAIDEIKAAARKVVLMARTSGGAAGRDSDLCKALDELEPLIATPPKQKKSFEPKYRYSKNIGERGGYYFLNAEDAPPISKKLEKPSEEEKKDWICENYNGGWELWVDPVALYDALHNIPPKQEKERKVHIIKGNPALPDGWCETCGTYLSNCSQYKSMKQEKE